MKKTTSLIVAAFVAVCVAAGVAFWLLSSGAPSYDKICRMNDDLKQARQLGLSTQEKCAERLGTAILKTTDETILANLLANVSFEERFANAILNKIKSPEAIETIARTFKTELLAGESDTSFAEHLFDAVLDRLADDAAVERIVTARLAEIGGEPIAKTGTRSKDASGKSNLVAGLVRRILAMHDGERSETLLEKTTGSGILRTLPLDTRLEIAIRSKSESVGQATGVDPDVLELRDLVAKWDSESLDLSVQEVLDRGREIRDAQKYVEIVQRFDPDYTNADIDKWVEYGKSIKPLLDSIDRLSNEQADSSDSLRRSRLVAKRDKAQASFDECKKVIDETRAAVNANDFATIMAACKFAGVSFDASDPEDTGWRLGNKLKQLYQQAQTEKEDAERELAVLNRAKSAQRASSQNEVSRIKDQLETIRQSHETPESQSSRTIRLAREVQEKAEREAQEKAEREARWKIESESYENRRAEALEFLRSSPYIMRLSEKRDRALNKWSAGDSDSTVMRALRWLKMQQLEDGSWGDNGMHKIALTGMAVLTYLAHNETPAPDTEFGPTVERAIRFLVDSLGSDESFKYKDDNNLSQPIGVNALGEAYAMTKNPIIKDAVERAVLPIIRGQNVYNGWDNKMIQTDRTDTTYTGWCVQAVKAVYDSGIQVPGLVECYEKSKHAFDSVYCGEGQFGDYSENGNVSRGGRANTPIATFCLQIVEQFADSKVKSAMRFMDSCTCDFKRWENQPWGGGGNNSSPVYYWYYLTQAKFQEGGATFGAWNKMFLPELQKRQQIIKGEGGASGYVDLNGKYRDIGWWDSPSKDESLIKNDGGLPCTWYKFGTAVQGSTSLDCRIMDTCLCTLQLMVYYRILPSSQAR